MFAQIQKFTSEVVIELKKVAWPTRQELIDSTIIVITTAVILGFFICAVDFVLSKLLGLIIR